MTPETETAPQAAPADAALAALRAEIDRLDDAMHDLLMQRAAVVSRMAESRAKGGTVPLRPGREAQVLRRLLARHQGRLPAAAIIRLWREIFAAHTAMQGQFSVALFARRPEHERLAREHFGALTPLRSHPSAAAAMAAVASGQAGIAVLPAPEDGEPAEAAWWLSLDAPRLQVVARLPFFAAAEPVAEAFAIAPVAPDESGRDASLLRLEAAGLLARGVVNTALAAAGLPPRSLLLRHDGGRTRALAEVPGAVVAGDPRLASLRYERVLPLGCYALPERGTQA